MLGECSTKKDLDSNINCFTYFFVVLVRRSPLTPSVDQDDNSIKFDKRKHEHKLS